MSKPVKWTITILVLAAIVAGLGVSYHFAHKEVVADAEREKPPESPKRVFRNGAGENIIKIDAETRAMIKLGTETPAARSLAPEARAYGLVLDPSSLVSQYGELASAETSLTASQAAFKRLEGLAGDGGEISLKTLEASRAQFQSDENRVRIARKMLQATWGTTIANLKPADLDELVEKVSARAALFVRVSLPPGEGMDISPAGAKVAIPDYERYAVTASSVEDAPSLDSRFQGRTFILRLNSSLAALRPGMAVTALLQLPGKPLEGCVIKRSSVVRYNGKTWVYVKVPGEGTAMKAEQPQPRKKDKDDDDDDDKDKKKDEKKEPAPTGPLEFFCRREVVLSRVTDDGWFVPKDKCPGGEIVTQGAQLLLSEELKSQIQVAD